MPFEFSPVTAEQSRRDSIHGHAHVQAQGIAKEADKVVKTFDQGRKVHPSEVRALLEHTALLLQYVTELNAVQNSFAGEATNG